MTNYNSTIFSEYINMSESNVIKGQAWIKGDKLLQDQIVFLNNIPTENIVVLISNIWDNLLKGPKEGEPTAKTNGKGYFYWELEINSIDNESELVKFLVECPKPREEDFIESSEEASNLATYKDSSEWANYWYERYKTAMENAEKKMTIQRKEVVFGGSNYIDPNGEPQTIEEKHVQTDHVLGSIANLLMMF